MSQITRVIVIVAIVTVVTVAFARAGWKSFSRTHVPAALPQVGPSQIVRFTIYDDAVRPATARISSGWVVIYMDDRSTNSVGVQIQNALGVTLGQAVRADHRRGSVRVYLKAGDYKIVDLTRLTHSATLTVHP